MMTLLFISNLSLSYFQVTVYRCEQLALDCSHCQALNKLLYSCFWYTNNECVHNVANRVSNCPPPNITKITPTTGPIHGGTYVTIYGSNLGRTMLDTETITVANVTCDLMNDTTIKPDPDFESLVPSRLICKTGSSSTAVKGAVVVVVEGNLSNTNIQFSYKSPSVFNIYPNFGPKAGGTKITIYGENLAIGNKNISLFLGNHRCEEITEVTEDRSDTENDTFVCVSKCSMSAPCSSNITELHLSIDGNYVDTNKKILFSFVDDPVVVQISPLTAFASGGRLLTIEGNLLNNAHSSSIKLSYKGEIRVANCEIVSDTNAVCEIPEAPRALKEQLSRQLSSVTKEKQRCYGRINVSTEINFDAVVQNFIISYTNDPMFDILPDDRNVLTFDATAPWIVISGKCFNTIHKDFDIDIKVGDKTCKIIKMTQTVISCVAPTVTPRVTSGNKHPEISVTVGNIQVTVGYLRYIPDEQEENPTMLILYISIAAFFSCIVFSGTICLCRRYKKLKNRVTYLEGKKPGLKGRQNERRQIYDRTIPFRQSGIYDEINDEDVQDTSIDIIGGANGDEVDDYLVPNPYDDIDEGKTFGHITQSQRETYALDNIYKGSVNLDQAYIHAINDVAQDTINLSK
ncbi:plexin-2-like [Ruditapes philippinarum]|uniref:plexin-2-like n=1 Tax=Ruditapes philippinarum TaxID=129788 RepID=UPI00295BC7F6|nr:plexin-2-like [Ruditapes philippinarum]